MRTEFYLSTFFIALFYYTISPLQDYKYSS
jgi:hypothetical protein